MTKSPSEDRRSEGVDGPHYRLNSTCVAPGCAESRSLQTHHMWRRSDVGARWWVRTKDGALHGNCVKVCGFHHRDLTDNVARIVYHEGSFYWKDVLADAPLLLDWQPPGEALYEELNPDKVSEHLSELISEVETLAAQGKTLPLDSHDHPAHDRDVCPTCLRKLPRPKDESAVEAKKVRKTWSVAVPLDRWEDGADVIDELLAAAHEELNRYGLPYGEGKKVKYFILTAALGMFVTHAKDLMDDG